jgi:hypothetical protein
MAKCLFEGLLEVDRRAMMDNRVLAVYCLLRGDNNTLGIGALKPVRAAGAI